jgi:hypothetical protein
MDSEYAVQKTYDISGLIVVSEIVKDEVTQYERLQRNIVIRSSCESHRWGTRTQDHFYGSPANWPTFPAELERMRKEAAETLVKIEQGKISERVIPGVGAQIIGPTGKRINALCNTNLALTHSLLAPEIIQHLELSPSGHNFYEELSGGKVNAIPIFIGAVRFGDIEVQTSFLPSSHNGPSVLGGHFHQVALQGREERISDLLISDHLRALSSAARCKKQFVLIAGKYGEHRSRLERIKAALKSTGLAGLILDEYPDIEEQSLADKMVTFASISRFVIVDDFVPSGHIKELEICHERKFITAVMREKGRSATAMQADLTLGVEFVKAIMYDSDTDLERSVLEASAWANAAVEERSRALNRLYSSWRAPEKIIR